MSDEQRPPAWAEAMEHRIITEVGKALADLGSTLRGEIADLKGEMNKRFNQVSDDMSVNMSRADRAHDRVDTMQEEVSGLRSELSLLFKRVRELERRLFDDEDGQS